MNRARNQAMYSEMNASVLESSFELVGGEANKRQAHCEAGGGGGDAEAERKVSTHLQFDFGWSIVDIVR